jgi:DNA-directed RNA polymerase subunit RPC12/RpoP
MLSNTSRQEIIRKIESNLGYAVNVEDLTPSTRQAIANLAMVQRHLYVITELLRGEKGRIERSAILRLASRLGKDSEKLERAQLAEEIGKLQQEVDGKVSELISRIVAEETARRSGLPPPEYGSALGVAQLKCPQCGAALPMPTGRYMQCQYCKSTLTVQDISPQLKSIIQSI